MIRGLRSASYEQLANFSSEGINVSYRRRTSTQYQRPRDMGKLLGNSIAKLERTKQDMISHLSKTDPKAKGFIRRIDSAIVDLNEVAEFYGV